MYNKYFGLEDTPFSLAPDPRYIYMSEQHREALAHLVYGFNSNGGFVLLTGDVGTGKTTICRCLLEQIPENAAIAFIFNPKLTAVELLATICDEFGIKYMKGSSSVKEFIDLINSFLFETRSKGSKAVLIIDEAQNLSSDVLEQVRLLTNLETSRHKLLHVILLGQPELGTKLAKPGLSQLSQRIIARYHLGPLSKKDVGAYVNHRLNVAGIRKQLFTESAINKLYHISGGVPRLINVLCDRALLGTYTQGHERVSRSTLTKAALELFDDKRGQPTGKRRSAIAWALMTLVIIAFGIALASNYLIKDQDNSVTIMEYLNIDPDAKLESESPLPASENNAEPADTAVPGSLNRTDPNQKIEGESLLTASANKPEPADTVVLDDLNITDTDAKLESESLSYTSLLKLWDIDYKPINRADACSSAANYGLRCMTGFTNMKSLKNINRPAVLKLFDAEGNSFFVTLIALNDDTATIRSGGEERTVSIKYIESQWFGKYTLFWRAPEEYNGTFRSLYEGSAVKWIRMNMAKIYQTKLDIPVSTIYDTDLVREIKKFQIANGLQPDGIAGPMTMIHMNTAVDSSVPTLTGLKRMN